MSAAPAPHGGVLHRTVEVAAHRLAIVPTAEALLPGGCGGRDSGFCQWVTQSPRRTVVGFWREVSAHLKWQRGLRDFHLVILPRLDQAQAGLLVEGGGQEGGMGLGSSPFVVLVMHGYSRSGPRAYPVCLACNDNAKVACGVWSQADGGVHASAEEEDVWRVCTRDAVVEGGDELMQTSFDAKARDMYVVVPKRHREWLSELDDDELYSLWSSTAWMLRIADGPDMRFDSIAINQGTYRNLAHLHAKIWANGGLFEQHWVTCVLMCPQVWVNGGLFEQHRKTWPEQRIETWDLCSKMWGLFARRTLEQAQKSGLSCGHGVLIVDRLPPSADSAEGLRQLRDACSAHGAVVSARIIPKLGLSDLCAIVEFEDAGAAAKALSALHASEDLGSRRLRVAWARPCLCEDAVRVGEETLII